MAYENKTVDQVYDLIITALQEKFNNELRLMPKSFVVVLAKVLAAIYIVPFKLCGWFLLQIFPDTASFDEVEVLGQKVRPLIKLGNQFGVAPPFEGKAWEGEIIVKRTGENKSVPADTQLKNKMNGLIYLVTESVELDQAEKRVPVYCTETGTEGNLENGDVLSFVNPIDFALKDAEVAETTVKGTNDETEESYRRRVVNRYSTQPQGGALADYRIWANDVAGVSQVYPYNDAESPGGVLVYVAGDQSIYPTREPDSALLVAVGKACTYDPQTGVANRKPITAVLDPRGDDSFPNVRAVKVVKFDVKITDLKGATKDDFGDVVKPELEAYFGNCEPYIRGLSNDNSRTDKILRNSLIGLSNDVALGIKASFDTLGLYKDNKELPEYTLGIGELATMGKLYINGVLYEG